MAAQTNQRWRAALIALILVTFGSAVSADTITLNDGSKLQGEVVALTGGVYTIRTRTMGEVRINAGAVTNIRSGAPSAAANVGGAATTALSADAIRGLQSSMTQNPGMLGKIMQLQSDPQMQAILNDPEVMRAVQNFDLETLQNHPKIRALMNNRQVREIRQEMR